MSCIYHSVVDVTVLWQVVLVLGGIPYLWRISGDIIDSYGYPSVDYEVCMFSAYKCYFVNKVVVIVLS